MARRSGKNAFGNDTRLRLINAAGQLFAEKGFDATTIREICDLAEANIAAVNYHFSGKMELYEATLQYTLLKDIPSEGKKKKAESLDVEDRIYDLVLGILRNIRLTDKPDWFPQLLRRETLFPTAEFQSFILRLMQQDFDQVSALIAELLPNADKFTIHACTMTLLGQVKSVAMESDDVLAILFPQLKLDAKGCEKIARHIANTSIAGMKTCYGAPKKRKA